MLASLRPRLERSGLGIAGVGAVLTLAAAYVTVTRGANIGLFPLVGILFFGLATWAFAKRPYVAVAVALPLLVALPILKFFVSPLLGGLKELIVLAAVLAMAYGWLTRSAENRHRVDRWVAVLVALLLALYVVNVGGGFHPDSFDIAWLHAVRLVAEPLALLLVGLSVDDPRRTFRWAMSSLIGTGCIVALVGFAQQVLGVDGLLRLGYTYDQLNRFNDQIRSFGTLDDPFLYAAFLIMGLIGVVFWMRPGYLRIAVGALLLGGIAAGLVRTSIVIVAALVGLLLARRGHLTSALFLGAAALAGGLVLLVSTTSATETKTLQAGPSLYLTLNGRTDAWKVALGKPSTWPMGRGVGTVGTAAGRAEKSLIASNRPKTPGTAQAVVDSGYFSVIADVGVVGIAVLFALLARLGTLAAGAARRAQPEGWVALGVLIVLLIDALTRDSLIGFPTAYVGYLMIGLAIASSGGAAAGEPSPRPSLPHRSRSSRGARPGAAPTG
jgi:hypothetical protein